MTSAAEKRAKALELHLAGANYDAIASAVGYASRSGAFKAVQAALKTLGDPALTGNSLDTELARLDAMLTGLWPKARRGDVQAVDRVLKIGEQRRQIELLAGRLGNDGQAGSPGPKETPLDELRRRRQAQ